MEITKTRAVKPPAKKDATAMKGARTGAVKKAATAKKAKAATVKPAKKPRKATAKAAAPSALQRGAVPHRVRTSPAQAQHRTRSTRLEIRATAEERDLLERAVTVASTTITQFMLTTTLDAARRLLAERTVFALTTEAALAWEAMNERPARDLPELRKLMQRPSPFVSG